MTTATEPARLEERSNGMYIAGTRLSVVHLFYWLQQGMDWGDVHATMPSLTREQFDVAMEYIEQHREELAEKNRLINEQIARERAEQRLKFPHLYENEHLSHEERIAKMREKMRQKIAERNGDRIAAG